MTDEDRWIVTEADSPLVATAIHAGHQVAAEPLRLLALSEEDRLREEDPFTDRWLPLAPARVEVRQSRFEFDLNRPPDTAIYLTPEQSWGLKVWKQTPPQELLDRALANHAAFYARVGALLDRLTERFEPVVVFDLHSYCHRRDGPQAPPADPQANPEINLGTESVPVELRFVVDRLADGLRAAAFEGRRLDVRENVKFKGGHFPRWVNGRYGGRACAIAIEVKKFFMDEWTGQADPGRVAAIGRALTSAAAGVERELADR